MKAPRLGQSKPFKGKSRRARKRREIREQKGRVRKFGYVDDNGKFHTTIIRSAMTIRKIAKREI